MGVAEVIIKSAALAAVTAAEKKKLGPFLASLGGLDKVGKLRCWGRGPYSSTGAAKSCPVVTSPQALLRLLQDKHRTAGSPGGKVPHLTIRA